MNFLLFHTEPIKVEKLPQFWASNHKIFVDFPDSTIDACGSLSMLSLNGSPDKGRIIWGPELLFWSSRGTFNMGETTLNNTDKCSTLSIILSIWKVSLNYHWKPDGLLVYDYVCTLQHWWWWLVFTSNEDKYCEVSDSKIDFWLIYDHLYYPDHSVRNHQIERIRVVILVVLLLNDLSGWCTNVFKVCVAFPSELAPDLRLFPIRRHQYLVEHVISAFLIVMVRYAVLLQQVDITFTPCQPALRFGTLSRFHTFRPGGVELQL